MLVQGLAVLLVLLGFFLVFGFRVVLVVRFLMYFGRRGAFGAGGLLVWRACHLGHVFTSMGGAGSLPNAQGSLGYLSFQSMSGHLIPSPSQLFNFSISVQETVAW